MIRSRGVRGFGWDDGVGTRGLGRQGWDEGDATVDDIKGRQDERGNSICLMPSVAGYGFSLAPLENGGNSLSVSSIDFLLR